MQKQSIQIKIFNIDPNLTGILIKVGKFGHSQRHPQREDAVKTHVDREKFMKIEDDSDVSIKPRNVKDC